MESIAEIHVGEPNALNLQFWGWFTQSMFFFKYRFMALGYVHVYVGLSNDVAL